MAVERRQTPAFYTQRWKKKGGIWGRSQIKLEKVRANPFNFVQLSTERSNMGQDDEAMFHYLKDCKENDFIAAASISSGPPPMEKQREDGLIERHSYSITNLKQLKSGGLRLVQLRNPWGDAHDWSGSWSQGSKEWAKHPTVARALNHSASVSKSDGLFWISWEDFATTFDSIQVCAKSFSAYKHKPKQGNGRTTSIDSCTSDAIPFSIPSAPSSPQATRPKKEEDFEEVIVGVQGVESRREQRLREERDLALKRVQMLESEIAGLRAKLRVYEKPMERRGYASSPKSSPMSSPKKATPSKSGLNYRGETKEEQIARIIKEVSDGTWKAPPPFKAAGSS